MSRTPEQIEADEELRSAIDKTCRAYGLEQGEHVTDCVAVASVISLDTDEMDSAAYFILAGGGPEHVTRGLLHVGLSILGSEFERRERDG